MQLSSEQEKEILNSLPRGTYALAVVYAVLFMAGWLAMWFGLFVAHGPVN